MKRFLSLLALVLLLAIPVARSQPPAKDSPTAPVLSPIAPVGMQRGTKLEVTLTGNNLANPTGIWTSFPAKVTIPTDKDNGKNATALRIHLEVPADAPVGLGTLRVATKRGLSAARPFCIDDLPQVAKAADNREPKKAQPVPVPCVVTGRMDAEATDYFKIPVKAGQRLSFEVLGRRLGSAFDPEITLLDAGTGLELPGGYSNDAPGLQTDPRLSYTFKKDGEALIALRDVSYRGGPDFYYRLRIGDFPCATTPLPLAVKRGSKTAVQFSGPAVAGVAPVEVQAPTDPAILAVPIAPRGPSGLHGWPVLLHLSDLDEQLEKEPNNDAKSANRVTLPCAITGRFEQKDDVDHYVFTAKKGQRVIIEGHTVEHYSPSELYLVLRDAKGGQVAASNPQQAPRIDYTAPADGDYTLAVEHLHAWGGPDEVYRLTLTPFEPSFALTVNQDRWDIPAGGSVGIPLFLTQAGYTGPIEVNVVGKGVSGKLTIPAGPAKPINTPSATIEVKADDVPPGPLTFSLLASANINGKMVVVPVSTRPVVSATLGNLPVPPRTLLTQLGVAVTEKPPFRVEAKLDAPAAQPGTDATISVNVLRQPGFTGEVALTLLNPPPGVTAAAAKVPAMMNASKLTLKIAGNVKPGALSLVVQGTAKHEGQDFAVKAVPVQLTVNKK
jgi:hypothetical protein